MKMKLGLALVALLSVTSASAQKNSLAAGGTLKAGEKLTSSNNAYMLRMQEEDGNLCIYKIEDGKQGAFVWCTMKHGFKNAKLIMQADGNLVVYDGNSKDQWSSQTQGYYDAKYRDAKYKPVKVVLENDGALKLYTAAGQVVWTNK